MTKKNKEQILEFFDNQYADAVGELQYSKDYELLIAVILSAQSTDKAVNNVTKNLFHDYPNFSSLMSLKEDDFANYFKVLGLYRNKAKHIYKVIELLNLKHNGRVPESKEDLMALPGVGIKTANVVRAELFKIPEIAVDTHVHRIAKRLGFAGLNDSIHDVELKLRRALPKQRWIKTHHQMIIFGRYFCKAQNPKCSACPLVNICREKNKNFT